MPSSWGEHIAHPMPEMAARSRDRGRRGRTTAGNPGPRSRSRSPGVPTAHTAFLSWRFRAAGPLLFRKAGSIEAIMVLGETAVSRPS